MRFKASIHGQMFALRVIPVVLLAIGFASALHLWRFTFDATAKSEHQNAIFSSAQALVETLLGAEAGARAYVATGNTALLRPYDAALRRVPAVEQAVLNLADADPVQLDRAHRVGTSVDAELAILARAVALTRRGENERARAEIAGVGTRTMDELRGETGRLESAAGQDATAKLARMKATGLQTLYTLVVCFVFGAIAAAAAAWQIRASIRRRVDLLVNKARQLADGQDIGSLLGGTDEIADLDRAFHNMAELLAERNADLERYRLLAERTQCLMLFARASDHRILHANNAAIATYGYSLAELRERSIDQLHCADIPPGVAEQLETRSSECVAYEADQRRADGSTFPGEVTVEGRFMAGEYVQMSIVRDITDRRRAESLVTDALGAAQSAARAKSQFLATMSHEIRTPMNAVIGMTELVLETPLTDGQREALQIVNESGTALLRIIDDVLDFSKIEAGKLSIDISEFPVARTIESVAVTLAAQARLRGLVLSVFVDPRAPVTLYGDAGRIRQVLTNLVGNAVKFTHTGTVMLSADVTASTKEWCEVRFSVTDTGIGIAPEQLTRIFQPFAQADASTTRVYGGSGLGLTICQQLVELMGGELRADSVPAQGSTFSFVLRLRSGKANVPIERGDLRALVVDASGEGGSELTRYVRAWGIDVCVVPSPAQALAACARATADGRAFDVAIIDADLLADAAYTLGSALAADARCANARRIFVAASGEVERRTEAVAAGFNAYLVRPLRQSQIFDCIINVSPVPGSPPSEIASSRGRRILLAEDNVINQRVALQQLYKLGYDAMVVGTGRAALAAVIGERFDAILMDCFMPEMDGYAATGAIRRHQSRTGEHTPIIAMTANAQSGDRDTCIGAGMDDYLAKPVTLSALRSALERYCLPGKPAAGAPVQS